MQSVYQHYGLDLSVEQLIAEIPTLDDGGTLAVLLGTHALSLNFRVSILTFNLRVFDPSWFARKHHGETKPGEALTADPTAQDLYKGALLRKENLSSHDLIARLKLQMRHKSSKKLRLASKAYIAFLEAGGTIQMEDLSFELIHSYLSRGVPLLTGLSSTFLYHAHREFGDNLDPDDVRGEATGHFVVLSGCREKPRSVTVADPYLPNPRGRHFYDVSYDRLVGAIFLGVLTYDANLLVIEPR